MAIMGRSVTHRSSSNARSHLRLVQPLPSPTKPGCACAGPLQLQEETLFPSQVDISDLELRVGRVNFRHSEIESCTRQD